MKRISNRFSVTPSTVLTAAVIIYAFILPLVPQAWEKLPVKLGIMFIFLTGVLSIETRKKHILALAVMITILEVLSFIFNLMYVNIISKSMNILFFLVVIYHLIRQIATSREVTLKVIFESISGYLLVGIVFSVLISFIMNIDPGAYNVAAESTDADKAYLNMNTAMYYTFISQASLGYGDIVPVKPYTRSLATFIALSGQLYIAVIIAMLVGKYSAQTAKQAEDEEFEELSAAERRNSRRRKQ